MTVEIFEGQKGLEFCKGHDDSNDIQIMDPNAWFRKKRRKLKAKMRKKTRTNKMAQQTKVLATKPDNLCSILWTYVVERDN